MQLLFLGLLFLGNLSTCFPSDFLCFARKAEMTWDLWGELLCFSVLNRIWRNSLIYVKSPPRLVSCFWHGSVSALTKERRIGTHPVGHISSTSSRISYHVIRTNCDEILQEVWHPAWENQSSASHVHSWVAWDWSSQITDFS